MSLGRRTNFRARTLEYPLVEHFYETARGITCHRGPRYPARLPVKLWLRTSYRYDYASALRAAQNRFRWTP
jgi:hypothetical protein